MGRGDAMSAIALALGVPAFAGTTTGR